MRDDFYYDVTSPTYLRWKRDVYSGKGLKKLQKRVGDVAGALDARGRFVTRLNRKPLLVSRVVWELHNGLIPEGMVVDHVNGFITCNDITNLRLVTQGVNNKNKRLRSQNTTGTPGVYWRSDDGAVISEYTLKGTRIRKTFLVSDLGKEAALRGAVDFRLAAKPLLVLQGYTERHINGN